MHPAEINDMVQKRLVHEIHTSERRSFRGCRRRWSWVFLDFYYPPVSAKPLEFGVAFHEAMEVLYEPTIWKMDREIVLNAAIAAFKSKVEEQRANFLKSNNTQYITNADVEQDYNERVELGIGMLKYYGKYVAPQYDKGMTPKHVEVEFIVPIQNPKTDEYLFCTCKRCQKTQKEYWAATGENDLDLMEGNGGLWVVADSGHPQEPPEGLELWKGLVVTLAGRIDLLAEDEHGSYWIVDWKTAARLARGDASGQDRDEFLDLDDQIGSYVMALRRKLGLNVRGFIYVELKKAFPEPPVRNANLRQGRWYSINKQQATDYETYKRTVMEEDRENYEAGNYDDFLHYLKEEGGRFHNRYQVIKGDDELEEIEYNLFLEASEMTDSQLRIYPSSGRFTCSFCAFRQPCLEKNRQGDYQFVLDTLFEKREKHYWVKELSTDKQGGE